MSAKTRLAQEIAALPDSLSLEEAVERLYRAFKLKHGTAPETDAAPVRPGRRTFQEMYESWRRSVDPEELITDDDDPFAGIRSRSTGRDIAL